MKYITHILLFTFLSLAFVNVAKAQSKDDRMVIVLNGDKKVGYRLSDIKEVQFPTNALDLAVSIKATPVADKDGTINLNVTSGADVASMKLFVAESYQLPTGLDRQKLLALAPRIKMQYPLNVASEFTLNELVNGWTYTLYIIGFDDAGVAGEPASTTITLPAKPLKGNPQLNVQITDITTTTAHVVATPNADAKQFYAMYSLKNDPQREQTMKFFGIPDMQHYVIRFGGSTLAGAPHIKPWDKVIRGLQLDTEYTLYWVVVDANGQYSQVYSKDFRTATQGTDGKAALTLKVEDITDNGVKITGTPNEATKWFKFEIFKKEEYSETEARNWLLTSPDEQCPKFTAESSFTWEGTLNANTAYYAVGIAVNKNNEPGDLVKVEFTTKAK